MPDNDTDYTPDFVTPGQVEANRAYALALMKNSIGGAPTNVSNGITFASPWGIASSALNGYAGRQQLNQAGQQERGSMVNAARDTAALTPPGMQSPINPPGAPQSYGNVTSSQESNGNYAAVGPSTRDGDHAYGKYQVKGSNIPQWTQEVLGQPMTPAQFLANPQAQDAVYQRKFAEYVQKYGQEGAARAWYGGEGNVNNPGARDLANPKAPTVGQYGQTFMAGIGGGGPAMAYAPSGGTPGQNAPGSPQATAAALRGPQTQPPAPNPNVAGSVNPQGGVGGPIIPQGLAPQRQQVTREQLTAIMANPYVDPMVKKYAMESYAAQAQPMQLQGPYGSQVIVNPQNPQQQMVIPPELHWGTKKVGPLEAPIGMGVTPGGYQGQQPNSFTVSPQSSAPLAPQSPASTPPAAPGMPPAQPATRSALDDVSPDLSPDEQKARAGGEPLKYAENEPGKLGPLSDLPPEITKGTSEPKKASLDTGPLATPPPAGGVRTAQAGPSPGVTASDAADLNYLQDLDVKKSYREEGNKQALESARKFYEGVSEQGLAAQQQHDELNEIQKVVNSPDFYSGFGGDWVLAWNRMKAALGGDPNSAAAMESFEKMRNDLNLSGLRTSLGGLGQVRLAEINMINNAFANKDNSIAANRALIMMKKSINDRIANASQVANDYVGAHGGVADQSLRNRLFNFYKNTPLMDDATVKQFEDQIKTESKMKPAQAAPAAAGGASLPPGYTVVPPTSK